MCGIAGIIDPITPPDQGLLDRIVQPLKKRGPDDSGFFLHNSTALVHTRLSIIDIEGGHQPIFNEDHTLAIIFNGEIYDFKSLRQQLVAKGHQFRTATDTEVLIHLYEDSGPRLLEQINGMFAFAIYDLKNRLLFMARDRFGQKPFFYTQAGPRFAFASGPQALTALDWVDATIDPIAVHDYLEYQYIPTPRSIHRGIQKLPPGHYAIWQEDTVTIERYWTPRVIGEYNGSYSDARIELREKLGKAIEKRLVADVPVGLFLSGGMDSSLICALAQQQLSSPALSFSIGFPEEEYDERIYAQLAAKHIGTEHHFLEVVPNDFDRLTQIIRDYEEPFCDASMLPTTLLAQFTRRHVKVALSGDGADELFGGYYRYTVMHIFRLLGNCPRSIRKSIRRILLGLLPSKCEERTFWGRVRRLVEICDTNGLDQYLKLISRFPDNLKCSIYGDRMKDNGTVRKSLECLLSLKRGEGEQRLVDMIMEVDIKSYLNDDILTKVDRASMAYGLEVRSPFLDVGVAELAMKLPFHWKQRGRSRKRILVDTFKDILPVQIFDRPKMGFGVPIARWLRRDWYPQVKSLLLTGFLVKAGYFREDRLRDLLDAHRNEQEDHSYAIFSLVVLEKWFQQNRTSIHN